MIFRSKKPKRDDTIRRRYLPQLAGDGLISGEPDPGDKRQKIWKVLRAEIIPKNTRIYTLLENAGIFNRETLGRGWQGLVKMTAQKPQLYRYSEQITIDRLWDEFFSKPSSCAVILRPEKCPEKQKQGGKNIGVSGTRVNADISAPKEPQIEEVE